MSLSCICISSKCSLQRNSEACEELLRKVASFISSSPKRVFLTNFKNHLVLMRLVGKFFKLSETRLRFADLHVQIHSWNANVS